MHVHHDFFFSHTHTHKNGSGASFPTYPLIARLMAGGVHVTRNLARPHRQVAFKSSAYRTHPSPHCRNNNGPDT